MELRAKQYTQDNLVEEIPYKLKTMDCHSWRLSCLALCFVIGHQEVQWSFGYGGLAMEACLNCISGTQQISALNDRLSVMCSLSPSIVLTHLGLIDFSRLILFVAKSNFTRVFILWNLGCSSPRSSITCHPKQMKKVIQDNSEELDHFLKVLGRSRVREAS